MDFDEYEYLERTVENPQPQKTKETSNGASVETVTAEEKERSRSSRKRSDNGGADGDDGSNAKRSKSRDESGSRDHQRSRSRDRERHCRSRSKDRERRHHSRSRDGESDGRRSRSEYRDKDRDKDKDREERNGRDRIRDRDRDSSRDLDRKEREQEKEKEKERSRRSRSRSERRSDRDDIDRERSGDREHKERERERDFRERDRDSRRHKEKKENVEAEVDPERDQRTVFAYQISLKASERDVYEFFSRAGKVRDVRLIMDRITRRSKGVGYVEFYDAMSVPMAIALSGQLLLGQPVMVKPSEAEKNLVQSTTTSGASGGLIGPYSGGARRLYVGNLHVNMTEEDLRKVFEPFGTVELVQLPRDETGHCKGFGFVQFTRLEDARNALNLNGQLEIAGRAIKVSAVTDQSGTQEAGQNTGDLDDDDGGLSLNAQSRALLMQKLDRTGTASSLTGSLSNPTVPAGPILSAAPAVSPLVAPLVSGVVPGVSGLPAAGLQLPGVNFSSIDTIGVPSECLLLKNMFDPKSETEPDFDLDIKEDVQEECSKFGNLKHIYVDKNSAGFVYLRFENAQSAMSAQRALHGRWFAGNMITATFMAPQTYEAKFP